MTGIARLLLLTVATTGIAATPENLLRDPGFDGPSRYWAATGGKYYAAQPDGGRAGGCLRYQKTTDAANENAHFDQTAEVEADTTYVASVWVKGDGKLRPVLRIASEDWQTLTAAIAEPRAEWQLLRTTFETGKQRKARFQLFGGCVSERRETLPGTSWFDDASLRRADATEAAALRQCRVTVDAGTVLREINPLFFGVNALFWIEDDASLRDGIIAQRLREMPCRLLRFPGGTAAENYHWRTGTLENRKRFPFKDGPATTDTDEFMKLCREVGAEPMLVVNLETSFLKGDLDAGVREACDWVRYCNKEKGYNVRYWEIGNEQYLLTNMTADQYATAFVRFARAMKAVDPAIRIGATGPESVIGAGAADRVPKSELKPGADLKELKRKYRTGPAWWPALFRIAGADMDMAVIHNYFGALGMDREVAALRRSLDEQFPNRRILIALTEWNIGKSVQASPMEQAMMQAEAIARFIAGGVDLATFWPLRFPGREWGDRSLLDLQTSAPRASYEVMKLFSSNIGSRLLKVETDKSFVHAFATQSADGRTIALFVVNRSNRKDGIEMNLKNVSIASGRLLCGDGLRDLTFESGRWRQPPQSLALIKMSAGR